MTKLLTTILITIILASCNNSNKTESKESALKLLSSPADTASAEPYLFTDKKGVVYLSWIEKTKGKSLLKFSVLNNENWSEADTITFGSDWFVNWADYPMLASDGSNNLIAHILQKSGKGTYAYDVKFIT
ncbi:MAG: hypothetical protein ABR503_06960, partial [Chitinophagaceae bacterium]